VWDEPDVRSSLKWLEVKFTSGRYFFLDRFSGPAALALVRGRNLDLPFILAAGESHDGAPAPLTVRLGELAARFWIWIQVIDITRKLLAPRAGVNVYGKGP
jgi:hypothetical protein